MRHTTCIYVLVFLTFLTACKTDQPSNKPTSLFIKRHSSETNIKFINQLTENEDFNIIEYLYFYNGGGVSIGDINNDGLPDVYFSGNQQTNKLYLNKGDLVFEDITDKAGVAGGGNWKTGVTMADVNADGLLDIYLCGVGNYKKFQGYNQLFINNGDLTFSERSKEFGLDFAGFSTQAAFFDYDLDGDLDMYLLNHSVHSTRSYGKIGVRNSKDKYSGDRLYKNQLSEQGKSFFMDVTDEAGILSSQIGYGLGIAVSDLNNDGYPDIYISNDFFENDYLYINQKNGTFKERSYHSFSHTSRFSMGNEAADLNNDLLPDIITLDMLPRDEAFIKTSAGEDSYEVYKYKLSLGFGKQVSRNALQLNRGLIKDGELYFTDIAQAVGIEATDWSWCPLAFDADGDGWKDLFIANGIVRRPNDLDYINFIYNDSVQRASEKSDFILADMMPSGKISNFIYKNDKLRFEDKTNEWGLYEPGFSNGAAYGDLDNDGDPDLIVNQINAEALVYENTSSPGTFIKISLNADSLKGNQFALGAKVFVQQDSLTQYQQLNVTRGWCSSSDYALLFARGSKSQNVTVKVTWPDGVVNTIKASEPNIKINYQKGQSDVASSLTTSLFEEIKVVNAVHSEDEFNAFSRESLIPNMLTTQGPPLAVADFNSDGLDDFFLGGAKNQAGVLYQQTQEGKFLQIQSDALIKHKMAEDTDAVFIDADKDGDQDLIVVSGGQEEINNMELLSPRLYLNNGKGKFTFKADAFQNVYLHASCVKPNDFDKDGDIDLFLGASVMPFLYGMTPMSFLLENTGSGIFKNNARWLGKSKFDNPTKVRPGMIKDAAWSDINKDGNDDLLLVGEWMPLTILIQQPDRTFLNKTDDYELQQTRGLWNSCEVADIDKDGDDDFILGNLGQNSRIKATPQKPLTMYLGDFDSNGGSDHILVYFNGDKSYPFASRDQLVKQIPSLKKKFLYYRDYRDVKLKDIITPAQEGNSAILKVDFLSSAILRNSEGKFNIELLPDEAQYFPVFATKCMDVNDDNILDILLTGNFSATQPEFGFYDAGVGLILLGQKNGPLIPMAPTQSGFVTLGEGRDIKFIHQSKSKAGLIMVSRNNESVLAFKKKQ